MISIRMIVATAFGLIVGVGPVLIHAQAPAPPARAAKKSPAKKPIARKPPVTVYADAMVGAAADFSIGYDTSRYTLVGEPMLLVKTEYSPIESGSNKWIQCVNSTNASAANCGSGHANLFFYSDATVSDGVKAGGEILAGSTTWMLTVRALPGATGQHWRARVQLKLQPR